MITNGKKQPFHSNAVVFNKADRSLQHKAVRLFIFKVLLDFCFHFFLRVQRPAKTSQPQNRVFSDELQKHDYLHFKKKEEVFHFTQVPQKKKKKDSLTLSFPLYLLPSSAQHLSLDDKPTSNRSVQPVSSEHTRTIWRAKSLTMVRFHLENNGNFTTTRPLPHICQEGRCRNIEGTQGRKKRYLQGNPALAENETWIGIPSITPIICSWNKIHQGRHYNSKRTQ